MAWLFRLDFDDGGGWKDITANVNTKSFRYNRYLFNELEPTVNNCSFDMRRDANINSLLTTEKDIAINIQKDSVDYFTGYVRKNFKLTVGPQVGPIKIDCVDPSFLIQKKIDSNIYWANYKVCDSADTSHSIVHQLMVLAGFTTADVATTSITDVIDYFVIDLEEGRTYWDILKQLSFEFGYVFYFNDSGKMNFFNFLIPSKTTTKVVNGDDMLKELVLTKSDEKYRGVEIKFRPHILLEDEKVFSDISGGTEDSSCIILVEPDHYYPVEADTEDWFLQYTVKDREIITVESAAMDTDYQAGIVINEAFVNYHTKAKFSVQNTSALDKYIFKFDVVGDATVKGDLNKVLVLNVAGTEEIRTYEAKWLTIKADAIDLASGLALYYKYSDFQYAFTSNDAYVEYSIGDIVKVTEAKLGLTDEVCLVISTEDRWMKTQTGSTPATYDWIQVRKYILRGIEEFSASSYESTIMATPPVALPAAQASLIPSDVMRFSDDQEGYDDVDTGATTTPVVPAITAEAIATRSIIIEWDRQLNLTNFDHYEMQVSIDDITWYALRNDGVDWKGVLDATTPVDIERVIHSQLPITGTLENPSGIALNYRVRTVTKEPITSSWSSSASATTTVVEAGDIAANSVYANALIAGVLNALIANISEVLQIADEGFIGQNSPDGDLNNPVQGDQRARLDKNELTIEYFEDPDWTTVVKLGGDENGGFHPWVQARGLAKVGAIDEISALGLGDSIPAYSSLFSFDEVTNFSFDQNGNNPWTSSSATQETSSVVYGAGALDLDTPPSGHITNSNGFGIKFNKPFTVDCWTKEGYAFIESEKIPIVQNEKSNSYAFGSTNNHLESDYLKADQAVTLDATTTAYPYKWDKLDSGTYYSYMYCDIVKSDAAGQIDTVTAAFSNQIDSMSSSSANDKFIQSGGVCRLTASRFFVTWEKREGTTFTVRYREGTVTGSSVSYDSIVDITSGTIQAGIASNGSAIDLIGSAGRPLVVYIKADGKIYGRKIAYAPDPATLYAESVISTSGSSTTPCSRPVVTGLSSTSAIVAYEYDGNIKMVAITLDTNHLITSIGSETSPDGVNTLEPCIDRINATHFVIGYIRDTNLTAGWKAYSVSGNVVTVVDSAGSTGTLLLDKPSVAVIDTSGNMVISYREYTTTPLNNKIHTAMLNFNGSSLDFTGDNIVSIDNDTEKHSLGAFIPRSYDVNDVTQRILVTTESYINAVSVPQDHIYYQALPLTYSKITLKGFAADHYVRLDNWGISKTQTDRTLTWGGVTSYHHWSIFFDPAADSLDFTNNGTDIAEIDTSPLVLSTSPCSFYLSEGWHDDLLVLPFGTISTAQSKAHYTGGLPWTNEVDFDKDLVLMPRSGGKIFLAENTEFVSGTLQSTISDTTWRIVGGSGEPAFQNSWTNYGAPYASAAFGKDPVDTIFIRGAVTNGTSGTVVFTLPTGYRPLNGTIDFMVPTANNYAKLTIDTSGNVTLTGTPVNRINIEVSFKAIS